MQKSKIQFKIQNLRIIKGFTLIELLIAIAIIGVLSAILMSNFIGIRQRARDGQRKSNLRQIQSALELYRSDIAGYPGNLYSVACPTSSALTSSSGTSYMQKIPCDPLNNGNYTYTSSGGVTYTLDACLENTADQEGTANAACPGGSLYRLTNP